MSTPNKKTGAGRKAPRVMTKQEFNSRISAIMAGQDPEREDSAIMWKGSRLADWQRVPDHKNGGATFAPRGGAALQIWQRKQWGD